MLVYCREFNAQLKMVAGDDDLPPVHLLPFDLLDTLIMRLPPLALWKLQNELYVEFSR